MFFFNDAERFFLFVVSKTNFCSFFPFFAIRFCINRMFYTPISLPFLIFCLINTNPVQYRSHQKQTKKEMNSQEFISFFQFYQVEDFSTIVWSPIQFSTDFGKYASGKTPLWSKERTSVEEISFFSSGATHKIVSRPGVRFRL